MGKFDVNDVMNPDDFVNKTRVTSSPASARSEFELYQRSKLEIKTLRENLQKSLLICEALWEIIRDKINLSDEELNNKIEEIDLRDGILDGKNVRQVSECPQCQRKVSPRHAACVYCGHTINESIFLLG